MITTIANSCYAAPPASASEVVGLVASTGALVPLERMAVRGKIIDMIAEVFV